MLSVGTCDDSGIEVHYALEKEWVGSVANAPTLTPVSKKDVCGDFYNRDGNAFNSSPARKFQYVTHRCVHARLNNCVYPRES
jgi:hypothetical protein